MSESVSELIVRSRSGDQTAREQLFDRYRHYLNLLAQMQMGRRLKARCEASDLVQQTLLEAHRDFNHFAGQHEGELLAWLRRILANNLFNQARYHAAQQRTAAREVSLEQMGAGLDQSSLNVGQCLAADGESPSSAAVRHEHAAAIASTIARLPEDYQQVIILRIMEGLSAEEVARIMDRSAGAVRMLQLRALTALRQEMRGDAPSS